MKAIRVIWGNFSLPIWIISIRLHESLYWIRVTSRSVARLSTRGSIGFSVRPSVHGTRSGVWNLLFFIYVILPVFGNNIFHLGEHRWSRCLCSPHNIYVSIYFLSFFHLMKFYQSGNVIKRTVYIHLCSRIFKNVYIILLVVRCTKILVVVYGWAQNTPMQLRGYVGNGN